MNNQPNFPLPAPAWPTGNPAPKLDIATNVGTKFDQDKPRIDLIDPDAIEGLARVLTFGAKKYAAHNWRKGIPNSRLIAALLRHMFEIMKGNYIDPESGEPHINHVGCCWMFLSNNLKNRPDLNDHRKDQ